MSSSKASKHNKPNTAPTVATHYRDIFSFLIGEQLLPALVSALESNVKDLFALARLNKATWAALAGDHKLWRAVYVESDPLVTPPIR